MVGIQKIAAIQIDSAIAEIKFYSFRQHAGRRISFFFYCVLDRINGNSKYSCLNSIIIWITQCPG